MAVNYRLTKINNASSLKNGWWYGRAVNMGDTDTDRLASMIEANCTVKRADILAVLSELAFAMKGEIQNGKRIVLRDLGSFKAAIESASVAKAMDYDLSKVHRVKILFQPEKKWDRNAGRYNTTILQGVEVQELPYNDLESVKQGEKAAGQGA